MLLSWHTVQEKQGLTSWETPKPLSRFLSMQGGLNQTYGWERETYVPLLGIDKICLINCLGTFFTLLWEWNLNTQGYEFLMFLKAPNFQANTTKDEAEDQTPNLLLFPPL